VHRTPRPPLQRFMTSFRCPSATSGSASANDSLLRPERSRI
jgi:hypothetical protein